MNKKNKKISEKKKIEKKPGKIKKTDNKKTKTKEIEKSELEEEVKEERSISDFFRQFQEVKSQPVLEKVARVSDANLEWQISNAGAKRDNEERRIVRYGGEKSEYETAKPEERRNEFRYAETPTTYDIVSEKKKDFADFNMPKQKWEAKERRKTMTEMERAGIAEFQGGKQGKKYLTKGGY